MKKSVFSIVWDYILIALGCLISAIGLVFFLEPYTIAPGGVTGLAIVIKKMSGIPIDVTNLVANAPLFIGALLLIGKKFGLKTAFGTVMLSIFIRLVYFYIGTTVKPMDDLLLAAIFGGIVLGAGVGIVFRAGGTTGGTSLAGAIFNLFNPRFSPSKYMMALDLLIVILSGIINRSLETALYSIISLYLTIKVADFIVEGLNYAKEFIIISDRYQEIGEAILKNMDRGATILKAQGLYSGQEKNAILCIVNRFETVRLKNTVESIDKNAFMTVSTVHEVLGEGFTIDKKY